MKPAAEAEEIRWQVLKAMLDEFPSLKSKAREYLRECQTKESAKPFLDEQAVFLAEIRTKR
jgi:hypothetical protein